MKRSRQLHRPWVYPPATTEAFAGYLQRLASETQLGYWVCSDGREIAGVVNISEIVRGNFGSGYLGFYAFVPYNGRGYMKRGISFILTEVFSRYRLHRLEANIQPGNAASRGLVESLGFRLEGFSPRYLKIGGRWRDHERWAITAEEWKTYSRRVIS